MAFPTLEVRAKIGRSVAKAARAVCPERCCPKPVQVTGSELKSLTVQKEKERKERETAEARERHVQRMKQLATQEQVLWKSVSFNLQRQTGKSYDLATEALKDLKALAEFQGKSDEFKKRLMEFRTEYARRTAVISRWEKAGLFW